ncbi:phosphatidate cytidylyltransferase [Mycoplasma sp. Mirounga ES2805-ORL]|uniref:phosphatidate cytidylyltransferase n=1 Tax=Mycoplasma sp. Mirounga ES2805-ORL TaxID=754514 RepID=UPI00197CA259|nr:phosphatidate cytidylyltransferase [Mycoplasma sp. Mirounga ES2805-ORL]QSF13655.1 phosphatidate cytidylyltransferase [Mycoplasma sp. Mirounga ES2805-ORL]
MFKNRTLPGLLITIFIVSWTIPLAIYGKNHNEARIAAYFFMGGFLLVFGYELFRAFRLPKAWVFIFSIAFAASILFPYNTMIEMCKFELTDLEIKEAFQNKDIKFFLVEKLAKNPWILLIIFSISIVLFFVEMATLTNMNVEDRIIRFFIVLIAQYVLMMTTQIIIFSLFTHWEYTLLIFLVPATCDTAGFFGGKYLGKKWIKVPFSPYISPKKTWEGFFSALFFGTVVSISLVFPIDSLFSNPSSQEFNKWIMKTIFVLFAPLFSVVGDLFFSYIKRINAIKDYSKILVGHGGFLDRFDSASFVGILTFLICVFM